MQQCDALVHFQKYLGNIAVQIGFGDCALSV